MLPLVVYEPHKEIVMHKEIAEANAALVEMVQKADLSFTRQMVFENVKEVEYQAYLAGWFLGRGLEVPKDCSKDSNVEY